MFVSRTPVRVSLFGGGTDYPAYFERRPGAVLGLTIRKYINIAAIKLTDIQDYRYRVSYSKLEHCNDPSEIEHPVVRAVMQHCGITMPLDISIMSDLPGNGSGLGSSSAFTVGFLNLIYSLTNTPCTKIDLARNAIMVERELLKENVGVQDQLHVSFGGVNRFDFEGDDIRVTPVHLKPKVISRLNQSLLLVHTGIARRATDVLEQQVARTKSKVIDQDLGHLKDLVDEATNIITAGKDDFLKEIGQLISDGWTVKRRLSPVISNPKIDQIYDLLMANGAYGAKLCGAGGGGFMIALVEPERMDHLCAQLRGKATAVPITIDSDGAQILMRS